MGNAKNHAVWEVYDRQRTCRFKSKYWARMLGPCRLRNGLIEYALLVTAPGSAVAGLIFWQSHIGQPIWAGLTIATALLGIAKPLLKTGERIERLERVVSGFTLVELQIQELIGDIRREDRYSQEMVGRYKAIERQMQEVVRWEPVEKAEDKLRQESFLQVNSELPSTSFHIPPSNPQSTTALPEPIQI